FHLDFDPEPLPGDAISIGRDEFDEACGRLVAAGIGLRSDRDPAWRDFAGWRGNYDRPLLRLPALLLVPYAPWSSDRSLRAPRRGAYFRRASPRAARAPHPRG